MDSKDLAHISTPAPLQHQAGRLYLVPAPLDFGLPADTTLPLQSSMPLATLEVAARLQYWVCENAKSSRAYLKRVAAILPLANPIQALQMRELPHSVHKLGDAVATQKGLWSEAALVELLAPALAGHDMGLVSEAGMPAVADPGSALVRAAHAQGIAVCPLVGPVSLLLALAASGMQGQHFAFCGYLPQEAAARNKAIVELERRAGTQTQICIETPYRNPALLAAMLTALRPQTQLCICAGLLSTQPLLRSASVAQWRATPWSVDLKKLPAVFIVGA